MKKTIAGILLITAVIVLTARRDLVNRPISDPLRKAERAAALTVAAESPHSSRAKSGGLGEYKEYRVRLNITATTNVAMTAADDFQTR